MQIDLHTHTIASDGLLAPEALVALAHDAGVGVLAVADHDSTDGVDPAMTAGRRVGMEIIPAVEIKDRKSTRLNSSHSQISYAVFCLKKKKRERLITVTRSAFPHRLGPRPHRYRPRAALPLAPPLP